MTRFLLVAGTLLVLTSANARAEAPASLSLEDVARLARAGAPAVRLADAEVDVARGRRAGARVIMTDNPSFGGGAGSRWGDERTNEGEVSLAVPIELGRQRRKRVAAADAAVDVAGARVDEVRRRAVGDAVAAYFDVLLAQEQIALAQERVALAEQLVETARARKAAGDAADFEVNLAESELARAHSAVSNAERGRAAARARLAAALGLESAGDLEVTGRLDDWRFASAGGADDPIAGRADLRLARTRVAAAGADVVLADAERWPDLSLRVGYKREERADIAFGGVAISLPIFDRGQGERAEARAARHRAELALETTETLARTELEGARAAFEAAVAAATEMRERAVPLAIENERMARESYAAGKLELPALLVVRRDALDTRAEYLGRLHQGALAAVTLWVARGAPSTTRGEAP